MSSYNKPSKALNSKVLLSFFFFNFTELDLKILCCSVRVATFESIRFMISVTKILRKTRQINQHNNHT